MNRILRIITVIAATALVGCEEHLKRNQDAPASNAPPPNSEKGTPAPPNPPPVTPSTGSQGTAGTGTR